MSSVLPLDEEQRDALQELLNISMGQAANSLAQLIETKIAAKKNIKIMRNMHICNKK